MRPLARSAARPVVPLLAALALGVAAPAAPAASANTNPTSVTLAATFESEIGCPSDWDPACSAAHLTYDAGDDVWQGIYSIPSGSWEYKAALDNAWDENYGLHAAAGGANIPLSLPSSRPVKFYYDHKSHWITDNVGSVIAVAPGSFQSELGCPGDWQPDCLRSWLQDPDGDGTYSFQTSAIPAGAYEAKVAINEAWDENYGQGGVPGGANIPFTVSTSGDLVTFSYNSSNHVLTITSGSPSGGEPDCDNAYTAGVDSIVGTYGDDVLCGGGGADVINGLGGNDVIYGDAGPDVLVGKKGNDTIHGGSGSDSLKGGFGADTLDAVDGVSGNDSLIGGRGLDVCAADSGDSQAGC